MKAVLTNPSLSELSLSAAWNPVSRVLVAVAILFLSLTSAFADNRGYYDRGSDCRPQVTCGGCSGGSRQCTVVACNGNLERYSQLCTSYGGEAPVPKFPEPPQTPWSPPSCSPQIQCGGCSGGVETCTAVGCNGSVRQFMQNCEFYPSPQTPSPPPSTSCSPQISCGGCSGGIETCTAISCSGHVRQFTQNCVYGRSAPTVGMTDKSANQNEHGPSKSDDDGVVRDYPSGSGGGGGGGPIIGVPPPKAGRLR